jgi:surfactin synthase thioesterase subunit
LARAVPPALEVVPVRLPGREQRFAEPPDLYPGEIASAICARADRPFAIFGHSLGARIGFEVVRELRRRGDRLPERLYVAAARPPGAFNPIASLVELDDEPFASALVDLLGAPAALRDNRELRELMLPLLRSDLGWLHRHPYQPEPPLDLPIVALAGADDTQCGRLPMLGWERHTSAAFGLHTLPGGHFFPQTHPEQVADLLGGETW